MQGWIKIHRKLIDWEWFQNSQMLHLFIHLLLKANHADRKWQGITVKRGQLVTGRKKLSAETGISEPIIRKCLSNLKKSGEIDKKSTNKYTIITICNYDNYQNVISETNHQMNHQIANKKPSEHHQKATNKNVNNNKNVKERIYSDEILNFYNEIINLFPERTRPKNDSTRSKWLETVSKLQSIEKYSLLEIKKIIKFTRKHSCWAKNILSLNKLRNKNKEGTMYIDVFAEIIKNEISDSKINKNEMQNTTKDPDRFKF